MLYIVSYDIVDDKRRTRLAKRLCDYGSRVQYSVFECDLTNEQLQKMTQMAVKQIDAEMDSVRIYKLCQSCKSQIISYGAKKGWEQDEVIIK